MAKRTFPIVSIIAAVALVGTLGVTVMATGGSSGGQAGDLLGRLHRLGHHLHGADHHPDHMSRLIEQLQHTPDQLQRLDKIHEIIGTHGTEEPGSMAELHDQAPARADC